MVGNWGRTRRFGPRYPDESKLTLNEFIKKDLKNLVN